MIFFHVQRVLEKDCSLYVVGEVPQLGGWNPAKAVLLVEKWNNNHIAKVHVQTLNDVQYKFISIHRLTGHVRWDPGENRLISAS